MPMTFMCPFWQWERQKEIFTLGCEGGKLKFLTADERNAYISRYCANISGWRGCSLAQNLQVRYTEDNDGSKG